MNESQTTVQSWLDDYEAPEWLSEGAAPAWVSGGDRRPLWLASPSPGLCASEAPPVAA